MVELRCSILRTTEQWATLDRSKTICSLSGLFKKVCQILIVVILPPLCSQDSDFVQVVIGHVL